MWTFWKDKTPYTQFRLCIMSEILCKTTHPTLGRPTIPHLSEVPKRPRRGPGPSASFFLGGILLPPLLSAADRSFLFSAHSVRFVLFVAALRKNLSIYTSGFPCNSRLLLAFNSPQERKLCSELCCSTLTFRHVRENPL